MDRAKLFKMMVWLVLALSLTACASGNATPTLNPTEGVVLLAGVYTTTITAEDLANDEALDPNLPAMQGDWRVTFFNDGKFDAEVNGRWVGSGLFTVKGPEIAIYISNVCDDCPCDESISRYNWALQDNQLYMVERAGTCDLSHTLFTTNPLVRQP